MLLLTCTPSFSVLFFLSFPTLIKHFFPSPWYSADVVRRSSSTAVLFRFWQRMLTSRCDEKTGGVPTIHHAATRNVFFRVKKKRKRKSQNSTKRPFAQRWCQTWWCPTRYNTWKAATARYWRSGSCTFWSAPVKMIHSADNYVSDWFWIKLSLILCHPAAAAMAAKLWCSRTISL